MWVNPHRLYIHYRKQSAKSQELFYPIVSIYFLHSHQILHGPTAVMLNGWYVFSS
jgi:hypothetical protein